MKTPPIRENPATARHLDLGLWSATLLCLACVACGPIEEPIALEEPLGTSDQAVEIDNGLAFNGLAFNGLAFNGLAFNGLTNEAFSAWFEQNTLQADMTMRYLVACAVPAGQTRLYTDGAGQVHRWYGSLGLAPDWRRDIPRP